MSFKLNKKSIKEIKKKIKELKGKKAEKCELTIEDFESLFDLDHEGATALHRSFDTDGNGTVEWKELIGGITVLSSDSVEEKAELLFSTWDLDGNMVLDRSEVLQMLTSVITIAATVQLCNKVSELKKTFGQNFDTTNFEDRKSVRENLTIDRESLIDAVNSFFKQVDKDGNGEISFEEFKIYCTNDPNSVSAFEERIQQLTFKKKGGSCSIM
ncbi:calcium binding protein [Anaeramoeba flamelloides]|uniref:Calcium binding protein n=1 Tax=Anaeramoeba flamelloides TaxID=1746091 RepID=A0AAV7Z2D1_9EUKA|nr:calcium binding protein [Anaeramoeba flamelloides]